MSEMIPAGQGKLLVLTPVNPVAGADFQVTQPIRTRWRVMSVKFVFTASAGVADRIMNLQFIAAGMIVVEMNARAVITASEVWTVTYMYSGVYVPTTGGRVVTGGMPENMLVNDSMVITSRVGNIQAGDQISDVAILVEEWMEPLA